MSSQATMRALVRGTYDVQKLRMATGLRVVANWKAKMGAVPGEKDDADARELIKSLLASHARLTDGVVNLRRSKKFLGDGLIDDLTELDLVGNYTRLVAEEKEHFKAIAHAVKGYPLWTEFLEGVKGVGPAMAGVLLSEIDITKARYPSSLWKYAGLDVGDDGRGRSRRKEHLVDVDYTDAEGNAATRKGITFNPFLKTKLMGVLADSFVRAGDGPYERVYRGYKHRLENRFEGEKGAKGHRDNMAKRYMVKMFLKDLYVVWRTMEGLPVSEPYAAAKLGIRHGETA